MLTSLEYGVVGYLTTRCHWVKLNGISVHRTSSFVLCRMLESQIVGRIFSRDDLLAYLRALYWTSSGIPSRRFLYNLGLDTAIQPRRDHLAVSRATSESSACHHSGLPACQCTPSKKNPTDRREPVQTRKDGLVACPKHLLAQLPSSRGSQLWPIQCLYAPFHVQRQEASTQSHPCSLASLVLMPLLPNILTTFCISTF